MSAYGTTRPQRVKTVLCYGNLCNCVWNASKNSKVSATCNQADYRKSIYHCGSEHHHCIKKNKIHFPISGYRKTANSCLLSHIYLTNNLFCYIFVVVNFDALAEASDIQIERRQVVFLCWMRDLNPGSQTPNRQQTECSLTNRLSYQGSS